MSTTTSSRRPALVEPVDPPSRFSQTFLRLFDSCKRSAYLYVRHKGGAGSHAMDRGTAFHLFAERALGVMLEQDEGSIPPELAKDLLLEVIREHPELTVPAREQDRLRMMAYHFAEGFVIDPARVVAVERKFVLEIAGQRVVGKLDFASISEDGTEAEILDFKTTMAMASEDELSAKGPEDERSAKAAQLLIYVLLFAFGQPVSEERCDACEGTGRFYSDEEEPECATCEGRGYFDHLEPPLGERVQTFRCSEVYPAYLFDDGLGRRSSVVTRAELLDHRLWLEALVEDAAARFETWDFPAVDGTHCGICPARAECPLPANLKAYRGEVNTPEEASEAASKLRFDELDLKARKKELRTWASLNGPIRYGADRVMDFTDTESRSTDWPGLEDGVERAVEYGEPFDLDDHRKVSKSTRFRDRKLEPHELAAENGDEPRDWGDEAPF